MRRWIAIAFVLVILCGCIAFLFGTAVNPEDYTGEWYYCKDSARYIFKNGLIACADRRSILLGETEFSGAYCFAKDRATLFVIDSDGVGEVIELYLVHTSDGDILCEAEDGSGTVWFCRNIDQSN